VGEAKEFERKLSKQADPDPREPPGTRPAMTRRDFLVGVNAGAVAVGVATGAGFASSLLQGQEKPLARETRAIGLSMCRVKLNIDGKKHDVDVDVRDSLWETMNYQLGLANSNLGCDRAQCGACAVLVDGRPMNSCALLSARLGRGQKILTVGGIAPGPGVEGLHPLQRAFWLEGGFQCGTCTRGLIMSSYALLRDNKNPTDVQIKDALSGNICRCGEYTKILSAVKKAAAELRGEKVIYTAPLVTGKLFAPVEQTKTTKTTSRDFEFVTPLGTIEQLDEMSLELTRRPGIVGASGSERTVTIEWDASKIDEAQVRKILTESGHPVRP